MLFTLRKVPDREKDAYQRLKEVLREFVLPASRPETARFDELAVHHVLGEPIPVHAAVQAAYEPFAIGEQWGSRWSTGWFRLRGHVPVHWEGREVVLRFEVGDPGDTGFGAEALVWHEQSPVQGLSPNHTEYRITRAAGASEPIELFVEAAANPRPPWGEPTWPALDPDPDGPCLYTLAVAELCVVDRSVQAFADDFRALLELLRSCRDSDARSGRAREALEAAAGALALDDVPGSIPKAWPYLKAELGRRDEPDPHRISAAGHAHLDTAWLWPLRETERKCARTFSTAVRLMEDYPDYVFACSQAQHLAWMKDRYPDLWERIRQRVATGQFEPTGCMWVEPDCNIPSGESLVRQIVYGKRFYLDEFGIEARGAWLPDTFGFTAALPQILQEGGVDWFFTQKLSWNSDDRMPHHTFLWEGIDGSRVVAHFPPSDTYSGGATPRELVASVQRYKGAARSNASLYCYGYGDGGGGPTAEMLEMLHRTADLDGLPRLVMEGPQAFFEAMAGQLVGGPTWVGELYLEFHRATYTTHADIKLANRRAELALREAELWAGVAACDGNDYPNASLERAWKTLLVHQFHDILPGSGIRWVYRDAARDHTAVLSAANGVTSDAMRSIVGTINTEGCDRPLVVFNSASHGRTGLVEVDVDPAEAATLVAVGPDEVQSPLQVSADGAVLTRVQVPGAGYATYDLVPGNGGAAVEELRVRNDTLENEQLRVKLDRDGLITSIYDKAARREIVEPGERANRLQLHDDNPHFFDAWDVDREAFEHAIDIEHLDDMAVVEEGPLRATIRLDRHFGDSRLTQWISLTAGSAQLVFVTEIDWHETHRFLKAAFPVAVRAPSATYEIQFGHVQRPTHSNTSWDAARFEVWGHQWADLSEGDYGVALLNDCKYGYDIHGNVMRLSLLRAPTWPDPTADRGTHRFSYALVPHAGDFRAGRVVEESRDLNIPLQAINASRHPGSRQRHGSFVTVDRPGVLIEAVKVADRDAGLVVRLAEVWGRRTPVRLQLPRAVRAAWRCDLLERDLGPVPVDDGAVGLLLHPFQLITLRAVFEPSRSGKR